MSAPFPILRWPPWAAFRPAALLLAGLLLLALLGGCATTPRPAPHVVSTALPATDAPLALAAASRTAGAPADESAFRLLPEGDEALAARLALLARARDSVDLMSYLLADDGSGRLVARALSEAAARGVRVRLLVDDLYAVRSDALLAALAAQPRVSVRLFNPLASSLRSPALRLLLAGDGFDRAHRRMHNKLLVVDGAVAVTGGRNIADEYFMRSAHGNFVDMDTLAVGAVVPALAAVFDRFWNSEQAADWQAVRGSVAPSAPAALDVAAGEPVPDFDAFGPGRSAWHTGRARVLADEPQRVLTDALDAAAHEQGALNQALQLLGAARVQVTVVSPYFIPGDRGLGLIERAVRRGVRLQVLTNSASGTDEPLAHWHYTSYRHRLLVLGVDLHEFTGSAGRPHGRASSAGRLHSKLAVVDRQQVVLGSMNMDARSAWLNTELGLQIDSPSLAAELLGSIERSRQGQTLSVQLTPEGSSLWVDGSGDRARVLSAEPGVGLAERLRLGLLSLLIGEDWL